IEHSGNVHLLAATSGVSLMKAALDNEVPGIGSDCGGRGDCTACNIRLSPEWRERVGVAEGKEGEVLATVSGCDEGSRLACQIILSDAHDGLIATLPQNHQAGSAD
ncbi:MAG: 2Fe-2S iron-sulfur cluster-binding protein, partial [Nevskiales bacterium]